jgi:hypothetical protein
MLELHVAYLNHEDMIPLKTVFSFRLCHCFTGSGSPYDLIAMRFFTFTKSRLHSRIYIVGF